jgi:uncharacterized protein YfaS (alpha-2-macroglobulin family)
MLRNLLILFLLSFCSISTYAQYKAGVQGTIQDKSGAAVGGAKLTLTSQETGVQHQATANDSGFYRFTELPPGNYSKSGRRKEKSTNRSRKLLIENRVLHSAC